MLFLSLDQPDAPVKVYINSPGGVVTSGMAIYDCMQMIPSPIETWCLGQAASMGSLLLTAGTPGQRFALPNARIMIHQPSGGAQGQATDILIQAAEIERMKKDLTQIYVTHNAKEKTYDDFYQALGRGQINFFFDSRTHLKFNWNFAVFSLIVPNNKERDNFMSSQEALDFGIIDNVPEMTVPKPALSELE